MPNPSVFTRDTNIFKSEPEQRTWPSSLLGGLITASLLLAACTGGTFKSKTIPRTMAEVPSDKLAYRFDPDVDAPADLQLKEDPNKKVEGIQKDFDTRRKDDALIRTVLSPDGQRAVALYATGETTQNEYRIDLYDSAGNFLRNVTPPEFGGAFPLMTSWSPDGKFIIFAGKKTVTPKASPTPTPEEPAPGDVPPLPGASPASTVAPIFAPLTLFSTEQIYICDSDGFDLKPLTGRDGLIYFKFSWAPDSHAITALACSEREWDAREKEHLSPRGRPRIITLDSAEKLLDDELTEAAPDWSPDSTKVATAVGDRVKIVDAKGDKATRATIPLHDPLIEASARYDATKLKGGSGDQAATQNGEPVSFNPIVRLDWPTDQELYFQTAYIRIYGNEPVNTLQRWHLLHLSPQASLMGEQPSPSKP